MSIFSGSYSPNDVHFLLKPIEVKHTSLREKERLIQQENYHYSALISHESLPSMAYLDLFHRIFLQNKLLLAQDLITLAHKIHCQKQGEITLISLARAGTPIGVLLKRILQNHFKRKCHHYSISIIRDRGIDTNALRYILQHHPDTNGFTFIDGWTGKGVIRQELHKSITHFNRQHKTTLSSALYVLNDIAGVATVTASFDDYLIPSSLLNSTISGLISRSILNKTYIGTQDFHGCLYYEKFLDEDLSRWFIDETLSEVDKILKTTQKPPQLFNESLRKQVQQQSMTFIQKIKKAHHIQDINLIKPGIGEATRVLLRRVPDTLILKQFQSPQTQHLILLAKEKQVAMIENPHMPYQAISIIKDMKHD